MLQWAGLNALEVNDLVKDYGNTKAVKGISFDIAEGEIFGLIGPNGAGKTTTLRLVATLLQITSGSIRVFGIDAAEDPAGVRKIISYLPEEAGAYKNLKGRQYLEFIANFFGDGKEKEEILRRGAQIAGLGQRLDDKIERYSKGMLRRLVVARALMVEPRLAILDEPTAGLDVLHAQEIRRIIKDFVRSGRAVLLSSHNMLEVEFLCDRIALINEGLIVERGTPQGLKERYRRPNLEEVFVEVVG